MWPSIPARLLGGRSSPALVLECFAAVGLSAKAVAEVPPSVLELGLRRDAARVARDFSAADHLRAEIVALGYVVEDTPAGTRIRR